MSYCRPASEAELLSYGWIPDEILEMNKDLSMDEFILSVRNGSIEAFMMDDEYSEDEKLRLSDLVEDVREVLVVNGFFRPEMMTLKTPELYFTLHYIVKLLLADDDSLNLGVDDYEEIFLPYFMSNEDYEKYEFRYERIESIINVLSNYLDEGELFEVVLEIMCMSDAPCDKELLEEARQKLVDEKVDLLSKLDQVFAML